MDMEETDNMLRTLGKKNKSVVFLDAEDTNLSSIM